MLGVYGRLCFVKKIQFLVKILKGPPSDHWSFRLLWLFLLWQSQEQVVSTLLSMLIKLYPKSPCLWVLVWPCNPCFIPNLSVVAKGAKLGIDSRFSGFYFDKYVELKFIDQLLIFISYIILYLYTIYIWRKVNFLFVLFVIEISQMTVPPSCSWYRWKGASR